MKIRPLSDRVLVRRSESQEKTPGGILLPDKAKEKPKRGEVLAVGDEVTIDDIKAVCRSLHDDDAQVVFDKEGGFRYLPKSRE